MEFAWKAFITFAARVRARDGGEGGGGGRVGRRVEGPVGDVVRAFFGKSPQKTFEDLPIVIMLSYNGASNRKYFENCRANMAHCQHDTLRIRHVV